MRAEWPEHGERSADTYYGYGAMSSLQIAAGGSRMMVWPRLATRVHITLGAATGPPATPALQPVRVTVASDFRVSVVRDSAASIPSALQPPPSIQHETPTPACDQIKKDPR
jgi:hypothetical protein